MANVCKYKDQDNKDVTYTVLSKDYIFKDKLPQFSQFILKPTSSNLKIMKSDDKKGYVDTGLYITCKDDKGKNQCDNFLEGEINKNADLLVVDSEGRKKKKHKIRCRQGNYLNDKGIQWFGY